MSLVRLLLSHARQTALIVLVAGNALAGCGSDSPPGTLPCVEGSTAACVCPGGSSGSQVCQGGAFGLCDCGSAMDAALLADASDAGESDAQASANDAALPGTDAASTASDAATTVDDAASAADGAASDAAVASDTDAAGSDAVATTSCTSDKDCKDAGKICDPLTKACVDCLADSDCGPLQHCKSLFCVDFTPCSNSLGCVAATGPDGAALPICDAQQAECVACLSSNDCPANNDCIQNGCVPFTPCNNSKDCLITEVCNTTTGRCAQCLGNNDCGSSQLCESGQCRDFVACSSDKQCTPLGLLCDPAKGKCSQCLKNTDCPEIYHCTPSGVAGTGQCTLDVCAQGQGACSGNAKVTCNAAGSGFGAPVACPAQTTCVAPGGKPECKPWVCTPGTACDGDKAVVCSEDGLQVVEAVDCAAEGKKCAAGACLTTVCAPGQAFCDGNTVKLCNSTGTGSATMTSCAAGTACENAVCKKLVCTPGAAGCLSQQPAICNPSGTGLTASGATCGPGTTCESGVCVTKGCPVCPADSYCDEKTQPPVCKPSLCTLPTSWGPQVQKISMLKLLPPTAGCDLDDDGKPNNVMGKMVNLYAAINDAIAEDIAKGNRLLLFESKNWKVDGATFLISLLSGARDASNPDCDLVSETANCKYTVHSTSYATSGTTGPCQPQSTFPDAFVTNGQLTGGGDWNTISGLTLPVFGLFGFEVEMKVAMARVLGTVTDGNAWKSSTDGQICGVVTKTDLETAIEALPDEVLAQIGGKTAALQLINGLLAPDIDLNDDGAKDAISVALGFESVPGQIVGLTPSCGDKVCGPQEDISCPGDCGCAGKADGSVCSDLNACTVDDKCYGGKCFSGAQFGCNDNNPCTKDACVAGLGCVFSTAEADGLNCTSAASDECPLGVCSSGQCYPKPNEACETTIDVGLCDSISAVGKCTAAGMCKADAASAGGIAGAYSCSGCKTSCVKCFGTQICLDFIFAP